HPGIGSVRRYERLDRGARGGMHAGPRWLAVYEMTDEAAARQYVKDNARPWLHRKQYSPWPAARKRAKTVWRMLWRQISVTGSTVTGSTVTGSTVTGSTVTGSTYQPPESIF